MHKNAPREVFNYTIAILKRLFDKDVGIQKHPRNIKKAIAPNCITRNSDVVDKLQINGSILSTTAIINYTFEYQTIEYIYAQA